MAGPIGMPYTFRPPTCFSTSLFLDDDVCQFNSCFESDFVWIQGPQGEVLVGRPIRRPPIGWDARNMRNTVRTYGLG